MTNLGMIGADIGVQGIQYLFIPFLTHFLVLHKYKFLSAIISLSSEELLIYLMCQGDAVS